MNVQYEGLSLIPSRTAAYEMSRLGIGLEECKHILEYGYEERKRAKGVIERWFDKGKKTYNVVAVRSFNFMYNEEVWLITHVGRFTKHEK